MSWDLSPRIFLYLKTPPDDAIPNLKPFSKMLAIRRDIRHIRWSCAMQPCRESIFFCEAGASWKRGWDFVRACTLRAYKLHDSLTGVVNWIPWRGPPSKIGPPPPPREKLSYSSNLKMLKDINRETKGGGRVFWKEKPEGGGGRGGWGEKSRHISMKYHRAKLSNLSHVTLVGRKRRILRILRKDGRHGMSSL
jgi:hypothetical protein